MDSCSPWGRPWKYFWHIMLVCSWYPASSASCWNWDVYSSSSPLSIQSSNSFFSALSRLVTSWKFWAKLLIMVSQIHSSVSLPLVHMWWSSLLHSSGTFCLTWARWLRLHRLAHCTWSLHFRYSVRAEGSGAYGWYRVARAWEISQAYEVFKGRICMFHTSRLDWHENSDLRSKSATGTV